VVDGWTNREGTNPYRHVGQHARWSGCREDECYHAANSGDDDQAERRCQYTAIRSVINLVS
jgi:hypothetical protein